MGDFIQLKVSGDVWLSACGKCREVVAFAGSAEALRDAESGHECPSEQDNSTRLTDVA